MNYMESAAETIEGIRLINEQLPLAKTILGISNVSFGLPSNGREVLNSVMLNHCLNAGLDYAIVNTQSLKITGSSPASRSSNRPSAQTASRKSIKSC